MSERSKRELYWGIFAVALGVLTTGIELVSLFEFGDYTEYFGGWWIVALEMVFGVFLLVRYRSDRFRQFSDAVGESIYFNVGLAVFYFGFGVLGAYFAVQAYTDLGEEGATAVLGLGAVFALVGFGAAGKIVWDTDLI